jgi:hypothetical protein
VPCDAAAFCSDFDPPQHVVPFGWQTAIPSNPDASVFVTDPSSISPPNSLRIDLTPSDTYRFLEHPVSGSTPVSFLFKLYVDAGGGGDVSMFEVRCGPAFATSIRAGIDQAGRAKLSFDTSDDLGAIVPTKTWLDIVVTITNTDTTLFVIGAFSSKMKRSGTCDGPYAVRIGFPNIGALDRQGTWSVLFDNVRVKVGQ